MQIELRDETDNYVGVSRPHLPIFTVWNNFLLVFQGHTVKKEQLQLIEIVNVRD